MMRKRHKRKKCIKPIVAILLILLGIAGGIYVGAWLMLSKPIIACLTAFDAGSITAVIVGTTILKCIFSVPTGVLVFIVCCAIASILLEY